MKTLNEVKLIPPRRYRTVNDLSRSLIKVFGLPFEYEKRIARAERMIHRCNPIVREYRSLAITYHRKIHSGLYRNCEQPECIQSMKLTSAWGIDRKAMQSSKTRSQAQRERRNRERVQGDGVHSAHRDSTGEAQ